MLKLRAYLYSKSGEKLSQKEIGKSHFLRVVNKDLGIDVVHQFLPKSNVQSKLEQIEYFKSQASEEFFSVPQTSIFDLGKDWHYVTYDKEGNELTKSISKKSEFYSLYKNDELITSDRFPRRYTNSQKKSFLKHITDFFEEELKKESEIAISWTVTEIRYFSQILQREAVNTQYILEFKDNPDWDKRKDKILETINQYKDFFKSELLKSKKSSKGLWQLTAEFKPTNDKGETVSDYVKNIGSHQTANYLDAEGEFTDDLDNLEMIFSQENYVTEFGESNIGLGAFRVCLTQ